MSYLPREEQPLSNIYPDLDIHSSIPIKVLTSENDDSNAISVGDVGNRDLLPREPSTDQNLTDVVPTIKETRNVPFDVPVSVGGTNNKPCIRKVMSECSGIDQRPQFDDAHASVGYTSITPKDDTYTRPDASLQAYQPFVSSVNSDDLNLLAQLMSTSFKVEYDLDEQDVALLGLILVRFRKALDAEKLEVIMSMLDVCAATILWRSSLIESQQNGTIADASRGSMVTVHSNGEENDNPCVICNSPDFNDSNSIVFCDGCDISVHQDCYGVPNIPEGFWFCKKCEAIREHGDHLNIHCELCPFTSGAFKRSTNNKWVHMVCALYTPRVRVPSETGLLEPIQNLDKVEPSRYALKCYVCNEKGGACIQCCTRGCFKAFHPTCARIAGFYMSTCDNDMSEMLKNQDFLPVYCDRHSVNMRKVTPEPVASTPVYSSPLTELPSLHMTTPPPEPASLLFGNGIEKVRALLKQEKEKLYSPRKSLFATERHENVYWRTPTYNTLIFPQSVVPAVQQSLKARFDIDVDESLIEFICRYWTIKKDMREGVMFNKRLNLALEVAALRVVRPEKPENKVEAPQNMLSLVKKLLGLTRSYLKEEESKHAELSNNTTILSRNQVSNKRERVPRPTRSSRLKAMDISTQPPQPTAVARPKNSTNLQPIKDKVIKDIPRTTVSQDRRAMKRSRSTAFHFDATSTNESLKSQKVTSRSAGHRNRSHTSENTNIQNGSSSKKSIIEPVQSDTTTRRARRSARPFTSALSEKPVPEKPNSKVLTSNKSDSRGTTSRKHSVKTTQKPVNKSPLPVRELRRGSRSEQKNKRAPRPGRALRTSRSATVY